MFIVIPSQRPSVAPPPCLPVLTVVSAPQVGTLQTELEATIGYLRRQEAAERRACEEEVAARDGELTEAEAQLRQEQRQYQRAEFGEGETDCV